MLLGFILPFALAFIAIPLESLIHSARTVGGVLVLVPVRLAALVLFTLGSLARHTSRVLVQLYDVAIVLPLLGERAVRSWRRAPGTATLDDEDVADGRRAL
jgi:cobalamin biosynthesis protein CobD/CbiB